MKKLFTLVLMLTACIASAQSVIYVNALTGNDTNDGLSATTSGTSGPKLSLSGQNGALANAASGDVVSVASGTYNEDVILDKNIVLLKTGSESADFLSFSFSNNAQLIAPKPSTGAFTSDIVTVNNGSSISDVAVLIADNGNVFVQSGTYDEALTLTRSMEITYQGSPTVRDIIVAGAGIEVIFTGKVFVTGSLQLNRPEGGYIVLSSSDITVQQGATVFPGNGNSYVKTIGAGLLTVPVSGNGLTIIPVGTADLYAPVTLSNSTVSGAADASASVRSAGNMLSFNPDLAEQVNSHIRLEWTLSSSSSLTSSNVRFDYTGAVEPADWASVQNRIVANNTGADWTSGTNVVIGEAFASAQFSSVNGVFAVYSDYANAIQPSSSFESVSVYPNPFQDNLRVAIASVSTETIRIQLVDVSGRVVSQSQAILHAGENTVSISDLASVSSGVYFLHLQGVNNDFSLKAVKF